MDTLSPLSTSAVLTRLRLVCDLVRLPRERFEQVENLLGSELSAYAELSIGARFDCCGVTTVGQGPDFVERLNRLMEQCGIAATETDHLRSTTRALEPHNVFAHLEVDTEGAMLLRWFQRRRPRLDSAAALARQWGDSPAAVQAAVGIARALGKDTVHFFGRDCLPGARPGRSTWAFSQYAREPLQVRDRVREACGITLGSVDLFDPAIRMLRLPRGTTAFLAGVIGAGGTESLHLTTPGFPAPGTFPLLDLVGRDRKRVERLAAVEQALDVEGPAWLSIVVTADGISDVQLFYRIPDQPIGRA